MTHSAFSTQASQVDRDHERCTEHRVKVHPAAINYVEGDNTLKEQSGKYRALRLSFRQVKGLSEEDIKKLLAGRSSAYTSINELRNAGVPEAALEKLVDADAFRSLDFDRRQALWEVSPKDRPQALFSAQPSLDAKVSTSSSL